MLFKLSVNFSQLSGKMSSPKENEEILNENPTPEATETAERSAETRREISWPSVLFFIHLNILGLYGILVLFTQTKLITIVFCKYLTYN